MKQAPKLINRITDYQSFKLQLEEAMDLSVTIRNKDQLDNEAERLLTISNGQSGLTLLRTKSNNYPTEIRYSISQKRRTIL